MKVEDVGRTLAVLDKHAKLPRNGNGVASVTIRQLMRQEAPNVDGILLEYICAFGAHGKTALEHYVSGLSTADKTAVFNARSKEVKI